MSDKVPNLSIRYKDAFEKRRLEMLAGENTLTDFLLGMAFGIKLGRGSDEEYPGWTAVERTRRDRGIKISHPKHGETVVYPEDEAYASFEE